MRIIPIILLLVVPGCAPEPSAPEPPVYSSPIVLFVGPDSAELEALTAKNELDFYTMADDELWYRSQAFELLDSLGRRYDAVDRAPMRFRVNGETREYGWRGVDLTWFVVVYDGVGEPRVTASVDLRQDLK